MPSVIGTLTIRRGAGAAAPTFALRVLAGGPLELDRLSAAGRDAPGAPLAIADGGEVSW